MKSQMGIRIVLLFMVLVVVSFDRHLSNYFPAEVKAMIQSDAIPMHSDLPVMSGDNHEDITLKAAFCDVPVPLVVEIRENRIFLMCIPRLSPHSVWQPPEQIL